MHVDEAVDLDRRRQVGLHSGQGEDSFRWLSLFGVRGKHARDLAGPIDADIVPR